MHFISKLRHCVNKKKKECLSIGTAMQGVIHYLIVIMGGVMYAGIGAATNFTNSGQVVIANIDNQLIWVIYNNSRKDDVMYLYVLYFLGICPDMVCNSCPF